MSAQGVSTGHRVTDNSLSDSGWKNTGIAGAVLLLVGVVALAMIAYLQSSSVTQTRVDLVGINGRIVERTTQFVSHNAIQGLNIAMMSGFCLGGIALVMGFRELTEVVEKEEATRRGVILTTMSLILMTMATVAAVFLAKGTTFSARIYQKGVLGSVGSINTTLLNVQGLAAFKTAAIVLAAVGGTAALIGFGLHYKKQNAEKQLATHVEKMNGRT